MKNQTNAIDWNKQEALQVTATSSMIAYAHAGIGKSELDKVLTDAIACCSHAEGHAVIILKGCLIKAMYALTHDQIERIHQIIEHEY